LKKFTVAPAPASLAAAAAREADAARRPRHQRHTTIESEQLHAGQRSVKT
jgi:hypothetical protein